MDNQQNYIHHPDEFPIKLTPRECENLLSNSNPALKLVCHSNTQFLSGDVIGIEVPSVGPDLEVTGVIDWCSTSDKGYELGITFANQDALMRIRMLEQLCYIQRYRKHVLSIEGRDLSEQDAALEWIDKYANLFPKAK